MYACKRDYYDSIQMKSDMTFPHVGQSSLFFIMFYLLDISSFFMALEV
jgi:hypothetical protein